MEAARQAGGAGTSQHEEEVRMESEGCKCFGREGTSKASGWAGQI